MKDVDYNIVAKLYRFITNQNYTGHYQFGGFDGNYKTFIKKEAGFTSEILDIIKKLKAIRVIDFYDIEYLKANNFPEKYYMGELVKESDGEYGFHYQIHIILFYYLFSHFRDAAQQFLKEIISEDFETQFGYCISRDKYNFQYPTSMHDQIFKYFDSRIPHFYLLHHQFNWLSDISYNDGRLTTYKINRIENCIEGLIKYDFSKVNLFVT